MAQETCQNVAGHACACVQPALSVLPIHHCHAVSAHDDGAASTCVKTPSNGNVARFLPCSKSQIICRLHQYRRFTVLPSLITSFSDTIVKGLCHLNNSHLASAGETEISEGAAFALSPTSALHACCLGYRSMKGCMHILIFNQGGIYTSWQAAFGWFPCFVHYVFSFSLMIIACGEEEDKAHFENFHHFEEKKKTEPHIRTRMQIFSACFHRPASTATSV